MELEVEELPTRRPIPGQEPWQESPSLVAVLDAKKLFLYEDEPWKDRARCKDEDKALFFPHRGQSQTRAKQLCAMCPVRRECEEYATRSNSTYGIWGGKIRHRGRETEDL